MESGSEHLSSRDTEPFDEAESESPVLDIDRLIEGALVRQLSRRVESALELFPPLSHDAEAETDTRLHEDPTMRQSTSTLPSRMAGRVSGNLRPVPFRPSHPLEREDVEPCDDFEIEEYFRQHRSFQRGKTRKQPQDPWWFGSSSCGEGGLSSFPRLDEWPPMMSGDVRPSVATEETSTVDNVNPGCLLDEVAANTATTASASPSDFDHPGKIRDDQAEEEAVGAAQLRAVIAAAEALGYGSTSVCATSPVLDAGSPTSLLEPQSAERQFQAVVAAANDVLRERERELASHRRSNALPSFGYFAGLIWNAMPHLFLEPGLWPSMSIGSNSTSPKHETGLHGRPSVLSSREPIHGGEGEPARRTVSVRQAARASTSTRPGQVAHTDSTHRWTAPERRGVGPEPDGLEMRPMVRGHYIPSDRAPPDDPDPSLGLVPYPPPPPPPLVFAPPTVTSNQARDWDWWQERAAGVAEVTKDVWTAEVCAQRLRADVGSRDAQADSDGTCELPKPKTADPADDSTRTRENDQPRQDRGCRNRLFDDDNLGLPQDEYIHQTTSRGQRDLAILLDQRDEPEQQQPGTPRMHWMD
ncbi:uncharacterized protein BJ171DRAFT_490838 [Polychytrium aggregatum]|uniref:uncharacterized protein n=1 Tax=Polychytrium aggregatum TaxID=110093 RepID=UPI0022FE7235|nr:uncharacterized protein BJ171DRAFT_490838 [Polychytrium aggregatum]KAI9208265.1 hypothetical protein BJ171DRAFT_490838 [Polychytrium aggregatum]